MNKTPADIVLTPDSKEAWRVINGLWGLLDDIDTLSDMAKNDYEGFAGHCYAIQQKRWKIHNIEDPGSICKTPAAQELARGWQDISTAPKDGSRILATRYESSKPDCYAIVAFEGREWHNQALWGGSLGSGFYPTHWQPLPEAPHE